jgi:uncharacterized protein (DUF1778 family)
MTRLRPSRQPKKARRPSPLMVRLDEASKVLLTQAAELRHISVSDYVRQVTVAQARKEVLAAREQTLALTPEEQLTFWTTLNDLGPPTDRQRRLGAAMRGES